MVLLPRFVVTCRQATALTLLSFLYLLNDRIQHSVDILWQIFQQQWQSIFNCMNHFVQIPVKNVVDWTLWRFRPWLGLLDDDEAVWFFSVLDPFDSLQLGINNQRPTRRIGDDCTILHRQGIRWKS